jgi:hypothetical protein
MKRFIPAAIMAAMLSLLSAPAFADPPVIPAKSPTAHELQVALAAQSVVLGSLIAKVEGLEKECKNDPTTKAPIAKVADKIGRAKDKVRSGRPLLQTQIDALKAEVEGLQALVTRVNNLEEAVGVERAARIDGDERNAKAIADEKEARESDVSDLHDRIDSLESPISAGIQFWAGGAPQRAYAGLTNPSIGFVQLGFSTRFSPKGRGVFYEPNARVQLGSGMAVGGELGIAIGNAWDSADFGGVIALADRGTVGETFSDGIRARVTNLKFGIGGAVRGKNISFRVELLETAGVSSARDVPKTSLDLAPELRAGLTWYVPISPRD